jgi:hypothetical protein
VFYQPAGDARIAVQRARRDHARLAVGIPERETVR